MDTEQIKALPKRYDSKTEEPKWQKFWEENKLFVFDPDSQKRTFSIDTPPPTVSGKMHMGHAFSYAQQDFVARFQRMIGKNVFYPFGTDDNGLPTEKLIEKEKKVRSTRMDRSEFVKLCYETIKSIQPGYIQSWKDIGMSCDFSGTYSTIDPHCQKISQTGFVDMHEKGLVYREDAPVVWCVSCQTAIAQAEFENEDKQSTFNDITFSAGGRELVVATTRPELIPACVALYYHPADKRYQDLSGKFAKVPLFDYEVPIRSDESVAMDKGTGLMMVCTFGDKEDVEKWHRDNLELRIVLTKYGALNELTGKYNGLKIKDARKTILADLEEAGLLADTKQITHAVNVHDKCGTEIEFLKTPQWYVKVLDKKRQLVEVADRITWFPNHMKTRYVHWVENLNWDWCISRQRHFGVPFPVWHCLDCGKTIVAKKEHLPLDPSQTTPETPCECGGSNLRADPDVMDTWATSSMSPQIVTNWTSKGNYNIEFKGNFPMSLRPQAHDIIRTWAFYTIVKGGYINGDIPWNNIMISGHAQDPHGRKMSKSKGNVIEPMEMITKYSADALRFWAAGSKLGDDLPFQDKDMHTGQKTVTKLWNASKFTLMHLADFDGKRPEKLEGMDTWILLKLNHIIKECAETFEQYEYAKTKAEAEKFFWITFCDNYLEICKDRIYNAEERGQEARKSAQYTLHRTLTCILKLFAPIMPHITESIYQLAFAQEEGKKSIHVSDWPTVDPDIAEDGSERAGNLAVQIIAAARKFKSENTLSLKTEIDVLTIDCTDEEQEKLKPVLGDIKATARAKKVEFGTGDIAIEKSDVKVGIAHTPQADTSKA